jgi:hypothetical protein
VYLLERAVAHVIVAALNFVLVPRASDLEVQLDGLLVYLHGLLHGILLLIKVVAGVAKLQPATCKLHREVGGVSTDIVRGLQRVQLPLDLADDVFLFFLLLLLLRSFRLLALCLCLGHSEV